MKNKIRFYTFLASAMLIGMICFPWQHVSAQSDTVVIEVGSGTADIGEEIQLPLKVDPSNYSIGAITLALNYDEDILSIVECTINQNDTMLGVCNLSSPGQGKLVVVSTSVIPFSPDFNLVTIALKSIGTGTIAVDVITLSDLSGRAISNYTTIDGQISVNNVEEVPANEYVVDPSGGDCDTLGGIWDANTVTCTFDTLTIQASEKLILSTTGVNNTDADTAMPISVVVQNKLNNFGVIEGQSADVFSTLSIAGDAINSGKILGVTVINEGTFDNLITNATLENLTNRGTINNDGKLVNAINEAGALIEGHFGTITGLDNYGAVDLGQGQVLSAEPGADLRNFSSGTIVGNNDSGIILVRGNYDGPDENPFQTLDGYLLNEGRIGSGVGIKVGTYNGDIGYILNRGIIDLKDNSSLSSLTNNIFVYDGSMVQNDGSILICHGLLVSGDDSAVAGTAVENTCPVRFTADIPDQSISGGEEFNIPFEIMFDGPEDALKPQIFVNGDDSQYLLENLTLNPDGMSGSVRRSAEGDHIITIKIQDVRLPSFSNQPIVYSEDVRTFTWRMDPLLDICDGLTCEAEEGRRSHGYQMIDDSAASGGAYVVAPSGQNIDYWNGPSVARKVMYALDIPEDGRYRINATALAMADDSNSFYVKIDNEPAEGYLWDVPIDNEYVTSYVNDRNGMWPVEVELTAGQHYVNFYLRETDIRLDKFTLEKVESTQPPVSDCSGLEREAEAGVLTDSFAIGNDSAASGGQYIHVPDGNGFAWNGPVVTRRADYCFTVEEAGTYRVKGWVYSADEVSDSFYVRLNDDPKTFYLWDTPLNQAYQADYVSDRTGKHSSFLALTPGVHQVTIYLREDGTRLDKLGLEQVEAASTTELVCGGLSREAEAGRLTGDFVVGNDSAASGGQFVHVPNGTGDEWTAPNAFLKAEYCFTVEEAGDYAIAAGVYSASDSEDSFYVQVDNDSRTILWDTLINEQYDVQYVKDRYEETMTAVSLTPGEHIVTIYLREDGTRLDSLALEPIESVQIVRAVDTPAQADDVSDSISDGSVPMAMGVYGEIYVQQSASQFDTRHDSANFSLTLRTLAADNAEYSRTVTVSSDGTYSFDAMPVGDYTLTLALPDGYAAITPVELMVTTSADRAIRISPDVVYQTNQHRLLIPFIIQ